MIFDIKQKVHLVIPMEKNESTKETKMWGSITDFNFDGRKKIDP